MVLVVDGQHQRMRLTLGALAELEEDLAEPSLMALVQRFEGASFSTRDVLALLCAGLRGGGVQMDPDRLATAEIGGGPMRAAQAAAELLARAFVVEA
ncbi:tail tube GTA-gp10-like protein [Sulfitobacter guttiformis]|uniref:Tail tube GTA-gp10-like protein n=1 Tax=Sulfitobacter guttiformis TaxID=74349 RepID=A0A420DIT0_9RHOB|nr:tail tube GTA-gp10-like protein [Sulfitobacter guttiformis]